MENMIVKIDVPKSVPKSTQKIKTAKDPALGTVVPKSKIIKEKDKTGSSKGESDRNFLTETLRMLRHLDIDKLLFVCDNSPPFEMLKKPAVKKKVIIATHSEKIGAICEEQGIRHEMIPAYAFDRYEKIKVALATGLSSGLLSEGMRVLCVTGQTHSSLVDMCMLTRIGDYSEEQAAIGSVNPSNDFQPQVLEAVLKIALAVGYEGFEGMPVGTIFVVGDSTAVMERSKQLTINPFQGYSEDEKNILDPKIREAIKNFCLMDGAFIIREDGVVLAAGRYLRSPEDLDLDLPLGLGTRNAAAMAVTKVTKALAFAVSKTSGSVRIYKQGNLSVELKQPRRRM